MKENTINEIKVDDLVFQALSLLTSLREKNLTDILTLIRKIEGVTTVTLTEAAVPISESHEQSMLKLKFVIGANQSWAQYKDALSKRIIEVDGVLNFEVKKVMDVDKRTVFTR
tara:strand:+ start:773 stop:1111 length:339 start_codon:yes stop_codon:yes gene_type:complete